MDQDLDRKIDTKDKIFFFFKENKVKLFLLTFLFVLFIILFIFLKINNEKKNDLISEKYIEAGLYLASKDNKNAKKIFEEIIISKNKFYSILALNTILEKKLETSQDKVLEYFKIVEDFNISSEQKDLIIFKKALYLIKNSKLDEGKNLLEEISKSESKLKDIAQDILNNN